MTKKIILKLICLAVLLAGTILLTPEKTKAYPYCLPCPEGTLCIDGACTCVCFDYWGNCTYSWSWCPIGNPFI